jgi:hypothetical protein
MDFTDLDLDVRCFALVGQFFHTWAKMEQALHSAIGSALSIDATKVQVLAVNINFQNKLYVLSTLVSLGQAFTDDEKQTYSKTIEAFRNNAKRNMIAHTPFEPHEAGVLFEIVKARGSLKADSEAWDVKKFEDQAAIVNGFRAFLDMLNNRFATTPLSPAALRRYWAHYPAGSDAAWNWMPPRNVALLYFNQNSDPPDPAPSK